MSRHHNISVHGWGSMDVRFPTPRAPLAAVAVGAPWPCAVRGRDQAATPAAAPSKHTQPVHAWLARGRHASGSAVEACATYWQCFCLLQWSSLYVSSQSCIAFLVSHFMSLHALTNTNANANASAERGRASGE